MQDDLIFADIAGHIVIDIEAAHEADKSDADAAPPAPAADAPEEAAVPAE